MKTFNWISTQAGTDWEGWRCVLGQCRAVSWEWIVLGWGGAMVVLILGAFGLLCLLLHRRHRRRQRAWRDQLEDALAVFHHQRTFSRFDGRVDTYCYSAGQSRRLAQLRNDIVRHGHGTARWLFYQPEQACFFIFELHAAPRGKLHDLELDLNEQVHPILPLRARRLLAAFPKVQAALFQTSPLTSAG